ncbi:radical SAM protein [Halodesulfovibrio aestuarii]|uniref:radical SAM protein n=1 Tax=Halodesulfovibrio aestuarii TaxID=126333 RepID=UPI000414F10C
MNTSSLSSACSFSGVALDSCGTQHAPHCTDPPAQKAGSAQLPFHPCFNEKAHGRIARIHVPIAPRCNLACGYCERVISPSPDLTGPGSASEVLSPEQGIERTMKFLQQYGDKSIVGIAGPGDPLANPETMTFLERMQEEAPHIATCLCTNGLALPQYAEKLIELSINTLTVTVNGVTPSVIAQMQPRVLDSGTWLTGEEAGHLLISRQMEGLRKVAGHMTLKINMVIAPEINMSEVEAVMQLAVDSKVQVFNPMPLIPRHALRFTRKPTHDEIKHIYSLCPPSLSLFTKCKQCRADAAGIHGKEHSKCPTIV